MIEMNYRNRDFIIHVSENNFYINFIGFENIDYRNPWICGFQSGERPEKGTYTVWSGYCGTGERGGGENIQLEGCG